MSKPRYFRSATARILIALIALEGYWISGYSIDSVNAAEDGYSFYRASDCDEENEDLLFETFEQDLQSQWIGKQGENTTGTIVEDPIEREIARCHLVILVQVEIYSL